MGTESARHTIRERFEDVLREVGTLLIAFAPLDVALDAQKTKNWWTMLLFLSLGLFFLAIALIAEQRRHRDT
jgi:hypothetical protein